MSTNKKQNNPQNIFCEGKIFCKKKKLYAFKD